jgi:hypothetical protein
MDTKQNKEYPRCPKCGAPVVGVMLTAKSVWGIGGTYYHPDSVYVHCESLSCDYTAHLDEIPSPSLEMQKTGLPLIKSCWSCNNDECAEKQYRVGANMNLICMDWTMTKYPLDILMEILKDEKNSIERQEQTAPVSKKLKEISTSIERLEMMQNQIKNGKGDA